MDLGTAFVTLLVAVIAVLPRVPALSADGRAQASIRRDAELWAAIPSGTARDRLGDQVEERTAALLDARGRHRPVETAWLYGSAWLGGGWLLLVVSTAMSGAEVWVGHLRMAVQLAGLCAGTIGLIILVVTVALVVWRAALQVYGRVRPRQSHAEDPQEPDQP
jgi:hypothetical protein